MIELYIDGASAGDSGWSGAGIFLKIHGSVKQYAIPIGLKDNHEAEYIALIKGLQICLEQKITSVSVRTDSQAVVSAIEKEYAKNEKYRLLLDEALALSKQFDLFFIKWIPSKQNKNADALAKKAIMLNDY
ncbi:reverse transcriptase-like protein [Bacillus chungangensis]|uniref:Ribonuclease HI n=1 Tax=Bacillus chungangensis TaxID=587633 RepID=A0ABT9WS53_9BACI|nr:reverse transcriptase-like protein [Bacillus chungangensis]MDQ0176123.1 ribonuclease HI [Bacillus chungangensis]